MFEFFDNMSLSSLMAFALSTSWVLSSLCELFEE